MHVFEGYGEALRLLREGKRLSQSEVAKRAKISLTTVNRYENERIVPSLDSLDAVLNALGADAAGFARAIHRAREPEEPAEQPANFEQALLARRVDQLERQIQEWNAGASADPRPEASASAQEFDLVP